MANATSLWPHDVAYIQCPLGHYTHQFLACDVKSPCWYRGQPPRCESPDQSLVPTFTCGDQMEGVSYTQVCDHRDDCLDGSDEDFCITPCELGQFSCVNKQCIQLNQTCDGWENCYSGDDEHECCREYQCLSLVSLPAFISLSNTGQLAVHSLGSGTCPHTHFLCFNNEYCLPLVLRCNGIDDCPGREDEADCDTCPGLYRCRASQICLLHSDLCDGHAHCPQHDDELMCDSICPLFCVCRGMAFFCSRSFGASVYPLLRFLDASGSGMTTSQFRVNNLLIHLSLAHCGLTHLDGLNLPNLLRLHVQDNQLSALSHMYLDGVPQLRELSLAGNPLSFAFEGANKVPSFGNIVKLDLSRVLLYVLNTSALSVFPSLQELNLSHSGVKHVQGGFIVLEKLRAIDLRACPMMWFPRGVLRGLSHLQSVHAHSFKLCCPKILPMHFNVRNCFAPSDELSSCADLLRGNEYKVCVFVVSIIALTGNTISFIFRLYVFKRENKSGYGNFVTHLSVSDFLMGFYLIIIGVTDQMYRGIYLWNDVAWKHSAICKCAGFLSMLSSELSVFIICLITLDRFLVIRFPFSRVRFSPMSAHVASGIAWVTGILLVSVPLLPITSHWNFYGQTGICIPLPITRIEFAGHDYSFGIVIVFNFLLFVLISLGQLSIYWSVRMNTMSVSNATKKTKDLTIARRLISVAMSDFLCWFPIGVLGLLAFNGVSIPGEVNVAVAIFVLPLNSAVNPCLYTLNIIMERRRCEHEERMRVYLLAKLKESN